MGLRIAHVTSTFPPYLGGTGNVCYQHALQLVQRGHDLHVFTPSKDRNQRELVNGIVVNRLRSLLKYGNAHLLVDLFRRLHGFDLIHLHHPFFGGETAALASLWNRTPLVITYHQDVLLKGPMRLVEFMLRHTLSRFVLRCATSVLFTTLDYGRASYAYPMLLDREDLAGELPNGVDSHFFTPSTSRAAVRECLDIENDQTVVLLVAALDRAHYFKGVQILLDALTRLPDGVTAVVVGDGDMRGDYQAKARRMEIEQRVRFAGKLSDDGLRDYYRAADVTVLPSTTMGEAFGLVLLESMSCGTPVIASDLPGVRSVVSDAQDGFLVPPGDADALAEAISCITRLTPELRLKMGMTGRQKVVSTYDWRTIGERLEAIYLDVLTNRVAVHANP